MLDRCEKRRVIGLQGYSRYNYQYSAPHARSKKVLLALVLVAVIVLSIFFIKTVYGMYTIEGLPSSEVASVDSSGFESTPASEWQRGSMPILYQKDSQWSAGRYCGAPFSESGCGPTCLAMVYIYLTGDTTQTPATFADMATSAGCAGPYGTDWIFMTEGMRRLGIGVEEVSANRDLIYSCLRSGNPIIATVGAGDFTSEGHFIVLAGINPDGSIAVHDPNSIERTQQSWDLDRLMPQFRNLWVYYS